MDIAKHVFQLHGVDSFEQSVLRKKLKRADVLAYFRTLTACQIGMEACGGAHHWARALIAMGHSVVLIAPQFVKPYVKTNKNDAADAQAICEAMSRPAMRFVPVKTVQQQDIQALHRVRSDLVKQRTAKGNQIRGLLAEYGVVVQKRIECLRVALPELLEDADNGLTGEFRALIDGLRRDLVKLDERVGDMDRQIVQMCRGSESAQRLQQIPGIGPLTASALIAAVGDGRGFKRGRDMAAFLGLVPRQHSSGGKEKLLGISKRGDRYVRTLLIHGARSVQRVSVNKSDPRSRWLNAVSARRHKNVAAVALANKNARMAWAVLSKGQAYRAAAHHDDSSSPVLPTAATGSLA
jgi:transposase